MWQEGDKTIMTPEYLKDMIKKDIEKSVLKNFSKQYEDLPDCKLIEILLNPNAKVDLEKDKLNKSGRETIIKKLYDQYKEHCENHRKKIERQKLKDFILMCEVKKNDT